MTDLKKLRAYFHEQIRRELIIEEGMLDQILSAYLCGAHVLLEGAPGVGKTTLAMTLGHIIGDCDRVQMTSDMSPADIIGFEIMDPDNIGQTAFKKGPIFTRLLMVDEVNRALPRTQSALLQAMEERKVQISGQSYELPSDFFVIATQNPFDMDGTYLLPASQLDRFGLSLHFPVPQKEHLKSILQFKVGDFERKGIEALEFDSNKPWRSLSIHDEFYEISAKLQDELIEMESRQELGARTISPRAWLNWFELSQCLSYLRGYDYLSKEVLRELFLPTMLHRMQSFQRDELSQKILRFLDTNLGI